MSAQVDHSSNRKYSGDFHSSEYIKELLSKLEVYYKITDPNRGEQAEKEKDLRSLLAITLGRRLFEAVAGWAIDHQVGLALAGRGPSFRGHPSARASDKIAIEVSQNNSHSHEFNGRQAQKLSPAEQRQALINIVQGAVGIIPEHMHINLIESLESLQFGYPSEIFEYRKASNKIKYRQRQLILKSIGFASYRQARDGNKTLRGIEIVEAFGLEGESTFKNWMDSSIKFFGEFRVKSTIAWARDHGRVSRQHKALVRQGKHDLAEEFARNEALYGDAAIGEAAMEFSSLAEPRRRKNRQAK
jgi:hypothetical protein